MFARQINRQSIQSIYAGGLETSSTDRVMMLHVVDVTVTLSYDVTSPSAPV